MQKLEIKGGRKISGTIVIFLFVKIVDANIGSVAFFEPEIVIVPNIFLPPLISNFCIYFKIILLVKLHQFASYIFRSSFRK